MRIVQSRRTLVAAMMIAVFAFGAAVAMLATVPADAEPVAGTHVKYYSSPALTTQVGFRYYDCAGRLQSGWGSTSPYSVSKTYGCDEIEPL